MKKLDWQHNTVVTGAHQNSMVMGISSCQHFTGNWEQENYTNVTKLLLQQQAKSVTYMGEKFIVHYAVICQSSTDTYQADFQEGMGL